MKSYDFYIPENFIRHISKKKNSPSNIICGSQRPNFDNYNWKDGLELFQKQMGVYFEYFDIQIDDQFYASVAVLGQAIKWTNLQWSYEDKQRVENYWESIWKGIEDQKKPDAIKSHINDNFTSTTILSLEILDLAIKKCVNDGKYDAYCLEGYLFNENYFTLIYNYKLELVENKIITKFKNQGSHSLATNRNTLKVNFDVDYKLISGNSCSIFEWSDNSPEKADKILKYLDQRTTLLLVNSVLSYNIEIILRVIKLDLELYFHDVSGLNTVITKLVAIVIFNLLKINKASVAYLRSFKEFDFKSSNFDHFLNQFECFWFNLEWNTVQRGKFKKLISGFGILDSSFYYEDYDEILFQGWNIADQLIHEQRFSSINRIFSTSQFKIFELYSNFLEIFDVGLSNWYKWFLFCVFLFTNSEKADYHKTRTKSIFY
eukprot:NODE_816_length_3731_cov_0.357379.p1 type:complete len:431 gc:universal NODE_816_length_3731_cov_0.357379:710-2002(+)